MSAQRLRGYAGVSPTRRLIVVCNGSAGVWNGSLTVCNGSYAGLHNQHGIAKGKKAVFLGDGAGIRLPD